MISMTSVWDDSIAFLKRESSVLVPVWLALLTVGAAGASLAMDALNTAGSKGSFPALMAFVVAMVIGTLGQLAVTAMVLRPGISVGEAINLGLTRLPKIILVGLCFLGIFIAAVLPLAVILAVSGFDVTATPPKMPASAAFYLFALSMIGLWAGARLVTMTAHIVDTNAGIMDAFRGSFAHTRGMAVIVIGVLLLYLVVATVIGLVTKFLIGGPIGLLGSAIGAPGVAHVVTALAEGVVSGAMTLVASLFIAHFYKTASSKGM